MPRFTGHSLTAFATNSGLLSPRMVVGAHRELIVFSSALMTPLARFVQSASMASHALVCLSSTYSSLIRRLCSVWWRAVPRRVASGNVGVALFGMNRSQQFRHALVAPEPGDLLCSPLPPREIDELVQL